MKRNTLSTRMDPIRLLSDGTAVEQIFLRVEPSGKLRAWPGKYELEYLHFRLFDPASILLVV